jgi:hypothetical protein
MAARQTIKSSLLKWAHHLNKGTTYGYAIRKDWLVLFGWHYFECSKGYIIADISLVFMRINDICGKLCFATKGYFFVFLGILLIILNIGQYENMRQYAIGQWENIFLLYKGFYFFQILACKRFNSSM